ncbi:hypothetical protein SAMN00768000_0318 [Sulfobacillus thermosulfidooxidans DSM 9293]|uniref:Uncharacterized protein n=1 Tax=Sulfobacillus thermosulfidooxidans (strain DSM 9293 / VKM B-1269 / AT-1) TaxID=929705 RepID=A0A1W1W763_SULTA|nr:hypothetical protein SAMN00768000_0318 [Sulfobacillus thermosulfidooxidans DSM 9293]
MGMGHYQVQTANASGIVDDLSVGVRETSGIRARTSCSVGGSANNGEDSSHFGRCVICSG